MAEQYFPSNDDLPLDDSNPGVGWYNKYIMSLSQKCWDHYDEERSVKTGRSVTKENLYTGSLGPCCYLRYRIATSPSFEGSHNEKFTMLNDALNSANDIIKRERQTRNWDNSLFQQEEVLEGKQPVTLLNGEMVGALSMKIVIIHNLLPMMKMENVDTGDVQIEELLGGIQESINQMFQFASKYILSEALPSSECEIFHGRSGYLKAIKFIRTELSDDSFGREIALEVIKQILDEGAEVGGGKLLLWKYKQKIHLGSLHGISGILHTLLDFDEDIESINPDMLKLIEQTVMKMNEDYCLKTGNLAPTLKSCLPSAMPKRVDKLVQFCSGSPGHILLLTQMHRKCQKREQDPASNSSSLQPSEDYLNRAGKVAESVLIPRGLLRKGVGLCHGISGNAFCFLSMYREMSKTNEKEAERWLKHAYEYANFGLDLLEDLESVPDKPYSLYEGVAGLICLLLGLVEGPDGANAKFPCYEF